MAFSRAFSKRSVRPDLRPDLRAEIPSRQMSNKRPVKMNEISLPLNLVSTTNMLSYDAPDIASLRQRGFSNATNSSHSSSDDSPGTPASREPSLTDGSSAGSSPVVEHNHLSAYFPGPTAKRSQSAKQAAVADLDAPPLPQRAPSHSKKEHERLSRSRSLRASGTSPQASPEQAFEETFTARDTAPAAPLRHPFRQELNQLDEAQEEFHCVANSIEQQHDMAFMKMHGLSMYRPSDYMALIFPSSPFEIDLPPANECGGWI